MEGSSKENFELQARSRDRSFTACDGKSPVIGIPCDRPNAEMQSLRGKKMMQNSFKVQIICKALQSDLQIFGATCDFGEPNFGRRNEIFGGKSGNSPKFRCKIEIAISVTLAIFGGPKRLFYAL